MKFTARITLIDCGKATKATRGFSGAFTEGATPPFTHQP